MPARGADNHSGPDVRVQRVHGVPTFVVDGEPFLVPCFETYVPEERYFRQFARAGVHVFNARDDTLYANRSFLTVHANGDGTRVLRFPDESTVLDAVSGERLLVRGRALEVPMWNGETRILRWARQPEPATDGRGER